MNYQDYIKTELLILIPVLYFIGIGLKKSKFSDKWIPLTLGLIGIFLSFVWIIATTDIYDIKSIALAIFTAVTQGVLIAGASVYANQLYIQSKK
jgi:multidrug transporter EmrE-like cation transporter